MIKTQKLIDLPKKQKGGNNKFNNDFYYELNNEIDNEYYTKYSKYKFKYLCLQMQKGGYNKIDAQNLAAAAIAVVNCTFAGTDQKSIDCKPFDKTREIVEKLEKEREEITSNTKLSNIQRMNKLRENQNELDKYKHYNNKKSDVPDISNRTCDPVLATVASLYLALIYATKPEDFITLMKDLINSKYKNCGMLSEADKVEKLKEIKEYYSKVLEKINKYLSKIGKPGGTPFEKVFTSSEYSKVDKEANEAKRVANMPERAKLTAEQKQLSPTNPTNPTNKTRLNEIKRRLDEMDDEETRFRTANEFMLDNLKLLKLLNLEALKQQLGIENALTTVGEVEIDPYGFIIKGSYKYDKPNNLDTVEDIIRLKN